MKKLRIALALLTAVVIGMATLQASALTESHSDELLDWEFSHKTPYVIDIGTKVEYHINLNPYLTEENHNGWISSNDYAVPRGALPPGMSLAIVEQSDMVGKPEKLELRGTPTKAGTYDALIHVSGSEAISGSGYASKELWVKFRFNVGETKEKYDLWVDGLQVTDANRNNILGAFSYDPGARVLTVKKDYASQERVMIRNQIDYLTIQTDEDVALSARFTVFALEADTTIAGSGAMKLSSQESSADSPAEIITVADGCNLTFQGAALTFTNQRYYSYGIRGYGTGASVTFRDTAATINGSMGAVTGFFGGISLEGSSELKKGELYQSKGLICKKGYSSPESEVIIESVAYDLWIEGEQVTLANRSNLLDGTFAYDPGSQRLRVLKSYTQDWPVALVRSEIDGLTVYASADATLSSKSVLFDLAKDATFTGPGALTLTTTAKNAVAMSGGASLTLDGGTLDITGADCAVRGSGSGSVTFGGADVHLKGGTAAVTGFASTNGVVIADPVTTFIELPASGKAQNGAIRDSGGNIAKEARIKSYLYELWIDGVKVNSGNKNSLLGGAMFYDPATKTLHLLKKDCWATNAESVLLISEVPGLTVEVTGSVNLSDFTLSGSGSYTEWCEKKPCTAEFRADTTITGGGHLSINQFPTLVTNGATLTVDGDAYLDCGSPTYGLKGDGTSKLVVGRGTAEGAGRKDNICGFAAITMLYPEETVIDRPDKGKIVNGAVRCEDGSIPKTSARIKHMKNYGLHICSTQVTDWNASDVLGDGVFRYDPDNNTLYLMGDCEDQMFTIIESYIPELTISALQDSTLNLLDYGMGSAIDLHASATITGPGSLTLSGGSGAPLTMNAAGDMTIRDADLIVKAGSAASAAIMGTGSWAPNKLTIESSRVAALSENEWSSAIAAFKNGIELIDCMVVYPEGGYVNTADGSIVDADGKPTNGISIRLSGIRVDWAEMKYGVVLPGTGKAKLIATWVAKNGKLGGCVIEDVDRGGYVDGTIPVTANYSDYYLYAVDAKTFVPLMEPCHQHFDLY
ncbi:MAG: hypothetical protein E7423_02250 [Ruminococcaceae bacterium]|nr:hypothetical protein [Oscillospiraceae bacterium]